MTNKRLHNLKKKWLVEGYKLAKKKLLEEDVGKSNELKIGELYSHVADKGEATIMLQFDKNTQMRNSIYDNSLHRFIYVSKNGKIKDYPSYKNSNNSEIRGAVHDIRITASRQDIPTDGQEIKNQLQDIVLKMASEAIMSDKIGDAFYYYVYIDTNGNITTKEIKKSKPFYKS